MKKLLAEILKELREIKVGLQDIRTEMESNKKVDIKGIAANLYDLSSKVKTSDNTSNKSSEESLIDSR